MFIPDGLEQGKIIGSGIYGPKTVAINGNYDDVNRLCSEIGDKYGWAFVNVNLRPYYSEGAKTHELSLPFGSKRETSAVPSEVEQEHVLRETQRTGAASESEDHHRWGIGDTAQPQEKPFVLAESNRPVAKFPPTAESKEDDPFFHKLEFDDPEQNATNITAISPYLDHRASIKPFVTLFTFLVIAFAFLAAIGYARPEAPESVLRKIPLIGAAVLRNNHLKEGILIKSLTTSYQTIQGNREVFLVSGIALNQNPVIVREIQLTGTVYNEAGKEIERQAIWAGNTLSPKIIRGMWLTSKSPAWLRTARCS